MALGALFIDDERGVCNNGMAWLFDPCWPKVDLHNDPRPCPLPSSGG